MRGWSHARTTTPGAVQHQQRQHNLRKRLCLGLRFRTEVSIETINGGAEAASFPLRPANGDRSGTGAPTGGAPATDDKPVLLIEASSARDC